jgi:hypothetical protein
MKHYGLFHILKILPASPVVDEGWPSNKTMNTIKCCVTVINSKVIYYTAQETGPNLTALP